MFNSCYLIRFNIFGHIASRVFGCVPEGCVFLLLRNRSFFVSFTDLILWFMNMVNTGQMDRGNENPTQCLPWWLRKTTKEKKNSHLFGTKIRTRDLPNTSLACYQCVTSLFIFSLISAFRRKTRHKMGTCVWVCVCVCARVCERVWVRMSLKFWSP